MKLHQILSSEKAGDFKNIEWLANYGCFGYTIRLDDTQCICFNAQSTTVNIFGQRLDFYFENKPVTEFEYREGYQSYPCRLYLNGVLITEGEYNSIQKIAVYPLQMDKYTCCIIAVYYFKNTNPNNYCTKYTLVNNTVNKGMQVTSAL